MLLLRLPLQGLTPSPLFYTRYYLNGNDAYRLKLLLPPPQMSEEEQQIAAAQQLQQLKLDAAAVEAN